MTATYCEHGYLVEGSRHECGQCTEPVRRARKWIAAQDPVAMARALWAVRVLDAYDPKWGHGYVSGFPAAVVEDQRKLTKGKPRWFRQKAGALSHEAARAAAAQAIWSDLSEEERQRIGERP